MLAQQAASKHICLRPDKARMQCCAQIARVLRRQRAERGALQLASPEVKFEIDTETHDPLDVGMYQVRPHGGQLNSICYPFKKHMILISRSVC